MPTMETSEQKEQRVKVPEIKLTATSILLCCCAFVVVFLLFRRFVGVVVLSPKRATSTCNNELGTMAQTDRQTDRPKQYERPLYALEKIVLLYLHLHAGMLRVCLVCGQE